MNIDSINPGPHKVLVRLEPRYGSEEGGIFIPETMRDFTQVVGVVIKSNLEPEDKRMIGIESLDGHRVVLQNGVGTQIDGNLYVWNVRTCINPDATSERKKRYSCCIHAIIPKGNDDVYIDPAVKRCKFCGPARPNGTNLGMMLVPRGKIMYCPRCNKQENGQKFDPESVTVS